MNQPSDETLSSTGSCGESTDVQTVNQTKDLPFTKMELRLTFLGYLEFLNTIDEYLEAMCVTLVT